MRNVLEWKSFEGKRNLEKSNEAFYIDYLFFYVIIYNNTHRSVCIHF